MSLHWFASFGVRVRLSPIDEHDRQAFFYFILQVFGFCFCLIFVYSLLSIVWFLINIHNFTRPRKYTVNILNFIFNVHDLFSF